MKANEFVKKFGWEKATSVVGKSDRWTHITKCGRFLFKDADSHGEVIREHGADPVLITDLKRLVESHELVEKHGGLFQSKVQLDKFGFSGGLEWYGFNGEYGLTDDNDLR